MKRKNFSKMVKNPSGSAELRKVRGKNKVGFSPVEKKSRQARRYSRVTPYLLGHKEISQQCRFCVGIDEAGRGPLAGPVSIGIAVVQRDFDWTLVPGVNDSKKLTEKKREVIFLHAQKLKKSGKLNYHVSLVSASHIDRYGISHAIRKGIADGIKKLALNPEITKVLLDGSLKAPEIFLDQETIIKGDAKEKIIGLASIMAKVTRDRYMVQVAKKYPNYSFEIHKGYGTKKHCDALERHGVSSLHRTSFCKRFL